MPLSTWTSPSGRSQATRTTLTCRPTRVRRVPDHLRHRRPREHAGPGRRRHGGIEVPDLADLDAAALAAAVTQRRQGSSGFHPLDPLRPPGRRFPRLPEVDALAKDLAVAELHDPDNHGGPVVVADGVLVDPQVVAADGPVQLELLASRVGGPEGGDVGPAADALAALGPLQHRVLGVDLRGAGNLVAWSAAGGADVGGVEMGLDHRPGGGLVHG